MITTFGCFADTFFSGDKDFSKQFTSLIKVTFK